MKALAALALQLADGERAVRAALQAQPLLGAVRVLAIGKAAAAMWRGAGKTLAAQLRAALIIAPAPCSVRDQLAAGAAAPSLTWWVGAHPVPDTRSVQAALAAQQFVADCQPGEHLLVLLSGGASALCELPVAGLSLEQLQRIQRQLLASSLPIASINAIRQRLSQIKAGGLARQLRAGVQVRQLLLSDVPGDDLRVIGSAPFIAGASPLPELAALPADLCMLLQPYLDQAPVPSTGANADVISELIASNDSVRSRLAQHIRQQGWPVVQNEAISGELSGVAAAVAECLRHGPPGYYLFGGETHLHLPADAGRGGRNQQLALALALALREQAGLSVMTLASDGVDGNSDAAGAFFHSGWTEAAIAPAEAALSRASSYDYWRSRGGLLVTGATGSNVADLILAWKQDR